MTVSYTHLTSSENNPAVINMNTGVEAMRRNVETTVNSVLRGLQIAQKDIERQASKFESRISDAPKQEMCIRDRVYIASQKEMCLLPSGKRKQVDRIVFRSIVFIRCTDVLRRKEIVHLPYIKRFMVNIAGERSGGIRPVAFIPDEQMVKLRRMLDDSEEPVIIDPRPLPLGARVRINGGKLHGLEGNVLEVEDGNLNFVIRVDLLGCAKVNITRDLLELL